MKTLHHTLLCTLVMLAALWATQSCTHNGGDVSPWWGTWHVERVEAQGQPVTTIAGDYFFQFQGEVVRLSWHNDRYDSTESYGNWAPSIATRSRKWYNLAFLAPKSYLCTPQHYWKQFTIKHLSFIR